MKDILREGMLLGERYEIISKIGAGGMSDVYKAKDHRLDRFVAVKVLKSWAYVFYDRADSKPVAKYQKTWTLERLLGKNFASTTLEERANAEALARGLCETRVLSRLLDRCHRSDPKARAPLASFRGSIQEWREACPRRVPSAGSRPLWRAAGRILRP